MKFWEQEDQDVAVMDNPTVKKETQEERKLVVYNDDHNTFEFVIETLMEVCGHSEEQAEQCTFIIHYKGKCTVKEGSFSRLKAMCAAICDRGLQAEIF